MNKIETTSIARLAQLKQSACFFIDQKTKLSEIITAYLSISNLYIVLVKIGVLQQKSSPSVLLYNSRCDTPVITLFISGLKSRVLKLSFLSLKMIVKSGLEFILKLTEPLQSCCCPVQKYLPRMAELAWQLSRYL